MTLLVYIRIRTIQNNRTHFFTNGRKGNKTLISIAGTISAINRTPVEGASHTLFLIVVILSARSLDRCASCWKLTMVANESNKQLSKMQNTRLNNKNKTKTEKIVKKCVDYMRRCAKTLKNIMRRADNQNVSKFGC